MRLRHVSEGFFRDFLTLFPVTLLRDTLEESGIEK